MKILCIQTRAPYIDLKTEESQEMLLAMASLGYQIQLLFIGQGVHQLLHTANAPANQRPYAKAYAALALYDIEEVYVCQTSLQNQSLQATALDIPCQALANEQIAELYQQATIVWTF